MKIKVTLIFLFVIVISIVTISILAEDQNVELADEIEKISIESSQNDRKWRYDVLQPVQLHSDIRDSLLNAMILKRFGNYLYVGDYGDMKIRRFTSEGKFVNEIGIGTGNGPGEFTQFMDFYVSRDQIYVLDLRKWMVIEFDVNDNSYVQSFKLDFNPLRVVGLEDKLVILSIGGSELFKVYSPEGKKLNQFGKLMDNQLTNPLSLQGNLISNELESEFIFTPSYASYLFYFNLEGKTKKAIQTVDKVGFPASERKSSGDTKIISAPSTDLKVESVASDNGLLYLQFLKKNERASQKSEDDWKSFVDVYDIKTATYLYSFNLPVAATAFAVLNEKLYFIRDGDSIIESYHIKVKG